MILFFYQNFKLIYWSKENWSNNFSRKCLNNSVVLLVINSGVSEKQLSCSFVSPDFLEFPDSLIIIVFNTIPSFHSNLIDRFELICYKTNILGKVSSNYIIVVHWSQAQSTRLTQQIVKFARKIRKFIEQLNCRNLNLIIY